MARVPTSNKYQWFVCHAPTWLPNILDMVCPGDTTVEGTYYCSEEHGEVVERLGQGQKDDARWMLTYLRKKWPTMFAQADTGIGMPVSLKPRSSYQAFAIWGDVNVTLTQQHIILWHLQQFFGHKIMVPQAKICELSVGVVNPKTVTINHHGKTLTSLYREIDDLIGQFMTDQQFRARKGFGYKILDIIVGGDYGQGSFCSGIKLILRR
jgi:hypothetical protein